MKHIHSRDIIKVFRQLISEGTIAYLIEQKGEEYIRSVLYYLYEEADIDNKETFFSQINQSDHSVEELTMSIAESLRQEGMQQGYHKAMLHIDAEKEEAASKAANEASRETRVDVAKNLITQGADDNLIAKVTGFSLYTITNLKD